MEGGREESRAEEKGERERGRGGGGDRRHRTPYN